MSYFPSTQLTDAGRALIIKALSGECAIEFTKVGIGNGSLPADIASLTGMQNLQKSITINSLSNEGEGAEISIVVDNVGISEGFFWTELGIFATDPDDGEILYAYTHNNNLASYIPDHTTFSNFRINLSVIVTVGDAENVTAIIGQYAGYAPQASLDAHINDDTNPHRVTKAQVGLGNVQNLSFANQPVSMGSYTLSQINPGETTMTIFGKIKAWLNAIASHFNASNPHSITPSKIGAAASVHKHSANDMNAGILPVERGGTGTDTVKTFARLVGQAYMEEGSTVPLACYNSRGKIDLDYIMEAGYYFIENSEGGPPGASAFHLIVFGDGSSACVQYAIVPSLYKSDPSQPTFLFREIGTNTFSWSSWTAII